jgi:hypothetical protein
LTHPEMVESLGHNVPKVFMLVFGAGSALAGLAGVIGGSTFVTEPAMAATVGSVIFVVVVVGGMGSLAGAVRRPLLIGIIQTFAVAIDYSILQPRCDRSASAPRSTRPTTRCLKADHFADRTDPAVPVPGVDPDLPAEGPARHTRGMSMDATAPAAQPVRRPSAGRLPPGACWSGAALPQRC